MPDGSLKRWPFVAPPDGTICILKGQSINELPHVIITETHIREDGHLDFYLLHDPLGVGENVLKTSDVAIFFAQEIRKHRPPLLAVKG